MIKKFIVIGAAIGAAGGFTLQTALTVMAYLAEPSGPGGYELVFQFVLVCIIAAAGAAVGSVGGLVVGIAVSIFSGNKD
jgi:hypothetical protein